jgi:hypothetical protein
LFTTNANPNARNAKRQRSVAEHLFVTVQVQAPRFAGGALIRVHQLIAASVLEQTMHVLMTD